jgi:anthranilate synthase component 2
MRLLLLDNYDSFTWNLAQYLEELGASLRVELNDRVTVEWVRGQRFDAVVISPGPGRPEEAGISLALVCALEGRTPLLGVCLGHQALALAHGGRIVGAPTLMHGKTSPILHDGTGLFDGLDAGFEATRYHSLVVDPPSLPGTLRATAWTADGVLMGIAHRAYPALGVQFHPESIMTTVGKRLLDNFLDIAAEWNRRRRVRAAAGRRRDVHARLPVYGNDGK